MCVMHERGNSAGTRLSRPRSRRSLGTDARRRERRARAIGGNPPRRETRSRSVSPISPALIRSLFSLLSLTQSSISPPTTALPPLPPSSLLSHISHPSLSLYLPPSPPSPSYPPLLSSPSPIPFLFFLSSLCPPLSPITLSITRRHPPPCEPSAVVFCSLLLLIREHQRARCQAEIPLTASSEFVEPLLPSTASRTLRLIASARSQQKLLMRALCFRRHQQTSAAGSGN